MFNLSFAVRSSDGESPGLVQGVTKTLVEAGVPQDNIRTEEFAGY